MQAAKHHRLGQWNDLRAEHDGWGPEWVSAAAVLWNLFIVTDGPMRAWWIREEVSETPFFCFPYYCFNISLSCLAACLPLLPFRNVYTAAQLKVFVKNNKKRRRGRGGVRPNCLVLVFFSIHLRSRKQQRDVCVRVGWGGGDFSDGCDSSMWWMARLHLVAVPVINIHARVWPLSLTRRIFHLWDIRGGLTIMPCALLQPGCGE